MCIIKGFPNDARHAMSTWCYKENVIREASQKHKDGESQRQHPGLIPIEWEKCKVLKKLGGQCALVEIMGDCILAILAAIFIKACHQKEIAVLAAGLRTCQWSSSVWIPVFSKVAGCEHSPRHKQAFCTTFPVPCFCLLFLPSMHLSKSPLPKQAREVYEH